MKKIWIFVLCWFGLNLLQSVFTELLGDEAYYWVYSLFPDRGYFDHPPAIAMSIRAGSALLPGEAGLRLMNLILGALSMAIIMYMLKEREQEAGMAFLLMASMPLMHTHVAGFLGIPDIPLLFGTSLFFLAYKDFLEKADWKNMLLLILSISIMLYSKYHAVLIIGFTLLSNLKLLRQSRFWIVVAAAVLLYLPHILWQIEHKFVSFSYHLVGRNSGFKFRYILEFLGSQILVLGPLTGVFLFYALLRKKASGLFERALKFNVLGIFLFFLFSSLKGRVEAHWTAIAFVPLLLFALPLPSGFPVGQRSLRILAWISVSIMLLVRLGVVFDGPFLPEQIRRDYHWKEKAMQQIHERAGERPLVFTNSYQRAALYHFYTGIPAHSQNNKHYRRNQYDLLDFEEKFTGKEVLFIPTVSFTDCDTLETCIGSFFTEDQEYCCFYNRLEIRQPHSELSCKAGQKLTLDLEIFNPTLSPVIFDSTCTHPTRLVCSFFGEDGSHHAHFGPGMENGLQIGPGEHLSYSYTAEAPDSPGRYTMFISFGTRKIPAGINGPAFTLIVPARSTVNSENN